jgi:hypothetical protein
VNYHDLPDDKKWLWRLTMDTPYAIGGHATDVSEIAYSLAHKVLNSFPKGRAPAVVEAKLRRLTDTLEQAEKDIQEFIELVSWYVAGGE